ncbi:MAG: zinc-binding dehydrogenase [Kiritimatiellae bacterium]|nr:zinc-binding dehydrogenase [Kiritimatiellia bacterium]
MKTRALRIYGKHDLRLEQFELPELGEDEILAEIISNSVCMSSHKAAELGAEHKRVPDDVAVNPTIIGHEFAGYIRQVGARWKDAFEPGMKFAIQPALGYKGSLDAPGYSFRYLGGMASFVLLPSCVMEVNCLLRYDGEGFFKASLSEPMSCIIGAAHAQYHMAYGSYDHIMGIVPGGRCAALAAAGPMGLGFVDYLIHGPLKPGLLVVTDIDDARLTRAAAIFPPAEAKRHGVELTYVNAARHADIIGFLRGFANDAGFDDVFVFAPVTPVVEQGDAILGRNGCLNFFAGPTRKEFFARLNFYNVHYGETHIVGTSGGNADDMREALQLMAAGSVNPAVMITHIGGITAAADTILRLPQIPGGKKLIYTQRDLPLTAIEDFEKAGKSDPFFARLGEICRAHNGLWNIEAEQYLLEHAPRLA